MQDDELIVIAKFSTATKRPSYEFKGRWNGKFLKVCIAGMQRAYKKHMASLLKELKQKERDNGGRTDEPTSDGRTETPTAQRRGQHTKRSGKTKT